MRAVWCSHTLNAVGRLENAGLFCGEHDGGDLGIVRGIHEHTLRPYGDVLRLAQVNQRHQGQRVLYCVIMQLDQPAFGVLLAHRASILREK